MSLHFPKHRSWSCIKIPNFFILPCARKFKSPAFFYVLPQERESCWNMAPDYNLALCFLFVSPNVWKTLSPDLVNSFGTYWILKMCLSTNEEPRTERVVNQIYVAEAGYNETINKEKCTCINNLKYQEHQNRYIKISWGKKYDSISDYCSLHHPLCWDLLGVPSPHHLPSTIHSRIMWPLFSPFQKKKKKTFVWVQGEFCF